MVDAARRAGLPKNLNLVHEPEAAATMAVIDHRGRLDSPMQAFENTGSCTPTTIPTQLSEVGGEGNVGFCHAC